MKYLIGFLKRRMLSWAREPTSVLTTHSYSVLILQGAYNAVERWARGPASILNARRRSGWLTSLGVIAPRLS